MTTKELLKALKYDGVLPIKIAEYNGSLIKWLSYEGLNEDGVDEYCLNEDGYYPLYLLEDEVKTFIKKNKNELEKSYNDFVMREV